MSVSKDNVKILLCGFYFQGNTGDDLLMESIVETLSRHGEVKVTSTETFEVELLDWCQLLVIGAGSLITPRGIGGYEHAKYAKENGKKVVYYSQTIEEGHPQFREHIARADLITVRDSESKKVVEANGFRAVFASDPIFKTKKRTIGFSFRRWVNEPPDIVERLASMLDNLAVDYEIFSLPYTENDTDTESDASFHEQVIRHMKNKPKQAAYDDAIQRVDLFMGMRLHALINGVNMGKRVLAIDYDPKVRRIFSDLAKNDAVVSYDDLEKIPYLVRNEIFRIDKMALREKVNEALVARMCADIRGEPSPKVSIVMPTYNRANYLKEAIDSILTQTIQDWELIIIDGGSTDNTRGLVESYREKRIKYYNFGNNGISYSRNIGNLLSRGEIIAVADSDDVNLPHRLEVACKEMEKSKADIVYSSMLHFDDTGKKEVIPSHPFSYERLKEGNFIYHPTMAYRRDVAMACPYNEDLEMVEDYHLYLQAAEKGYKFHQVEEPLVMHRLHGEQISSVRSEEMAEIHRSLVDSVREKKEKVSDPLVSVIVPTYNRPDMLKEALTSVLSQTYQNFEVIVVNDAGDDVKDVIDSLNKEGKIIYLQHKENRGLSAARNTGIKAAKGKYIAYLDDDDIYYPNHLETLVNFLENSDYKAAYTDSYHAFQEWITDRYVTVGKKVIFSHDFDRQKLLISNYIPVLNVVHRKDIIEIAGLFDETLDAHEDWEMWIRLSQYGDFHHINIPTTEVSVRTDETTMTSSNRMPFLKTMKIIHKRYSHLVTHPSVFEEQKKAEEGLARQVEIEGKDSIIPLYEYLHRYRFTKEFVRGKKVLNLACGEGYGSFMLSEEADSVVGIDIDGLAINHARSKHIKENLEFIKGPITDVPIEQEKIFDVIVCFEAMEPIQKYDKLMMEVKRLLKPDGIFIISTLNKNIPSGQPNYQNPLHLKGLYFDEFKDLLSKNFKNVFLYGQKLYPSSNIFPIDKGSMVSRVFTIEKGDEEFLFLPMGKKMARNLIAVASNGNLDRNELVGESYLVDISETLFKQKDARIGSLESAIKEKDTHIGILESAIKEKDTHIGILESAIKEKDTHIFTLEGMVREKEKELENLKETISQRDTQVSELMGILSEKDAHISTLEGIKESLKTGLTEKEAALNHIYNSHGWKTLLAYYRARDRVLPVGTRRRKFAVSIFKLLLIAPQITNKANVIGTIFRPKDNCPVTPTEGLGEGGADETRIVDSALSAVSLPITQSSPCLKKPAMTRKRILLVSYYCPVRSHAGGLRILDIYRLIKAKFPDVELDLYTCRRPEIDGSYKDLEDIYDNIYYSTTEELTVSDLLNQCQIRPSYDVIDLQFHQSARHIDEFRTLGAKILFTPMESLARSQFINAQEAFHPTHRLSLKAMVAGVKQATEEFKICLKADEVICVSRSDAAFLRAISLSKKIKFLETGISSIEFQDALDNLSLALTPENKENTILYVAYFGSETNVVALKWYLENVHPLIKIRVPDYILRVVGRGDLSVFSNYREDSIDFVGEVASLGPYIAKAKVGIAPALGGAGFRGKVNQYAIFGVPSVVSPIAAKGLAYENEVDIFIAEKPEDFAKRCVLLLMDNEINKKIGYKARQTAFLNYSWESKLDMIKQTYGLDGDILMNKPKVTALVPSFNHGRYLRQRIESVLQQTYPNVELIVIDDCSEDDSGDVIKSLQAQYGFKFIRNARNSGTPFAAWERILSLGTGEYIWICESDDYADPRFLEVAIEALKKVPEAALAYCDSWIIDEYGQQVDHTDTYFHEIWRESRWDKAFVQPGIDELSQFQIRGQTVPNMSSALISASAFRKAYHPFLKKLKLTGDWLFVGWLMRQGAVVYCKQTLNHFRRHEVTSRARVKSARSQAEFILTKYLLFRVTGRPLREFASVMSPDAIRFLYEPAGLFDMLRALFNISVLKTLQCGASLAASLAMNGHFVKKFCQRYKLVKGGG
jgi:glycosyltransferase involved in cell wall biosynthesis/polysaccharide pyruvyl transferase WcaK-like protein